MKERFLQKEIEELNKDSDNLFDMGKEYAYKKAQEKHEEVLKAIIEEIKEFEDKYEFGDEYGVGKQQAIDNIKEFIKKHLEMN